MTHLILAVALTCFHDSLSSVSLPDPRGQNPDPHFLNLPKGWDYADSQRISKTMKIEGPKGEAIFYPTYGFGGRLAYSRLLVDPNAISYYGFIQKKSVHVNWDSLRMLSLTYMARADYWAFPRDGRECALYLSLLLTRLDTDPDLIPSLNPGKLSVVFDERPLADDKGGTRYLDGNGTYKIDVSLHTKKPEPKPKWVFDRLLLGGKLRVQGEASGKVTAYFYKQNGKFVAYRANAGDRPSVILAILATLCNQGFGDK